MPPQTLKTLKTLDVRTRKLWRKWLEKHHALESEIWLVFYKAPYSSQSLADG